MYFRSKFAISLVIILLSCISCNKKENTQHVFEKEVYGLHFYRIGIDGLTVFNLSRVISIPESVQDGDISILKVGIYNNTKEDLIVIPDIRNRTDSIIFKNFNQSRINVDDELIYTIQLEYDDIIQIRESKVDGVVMNICSSNTNECFGRIDLKPTVDFLPRIDNRKEKDYSFVPILLSLFLIGLMMIFIIIKRKDNFSLYNYSFSDSIINYDKFKNNIKLLITENQILESDKNELSTENLKLKEDYADLENAMNEQQFKSDERHRGLSNIHSENIKLKESKQSLAIENEKLHSRIESLNKTMTEMNDNYIILHNNLSKILLVNIKKAKNMKALNKILESTEDYRELSIIDGWLDRVSSDEPLSNILSDILKDEEILDDDAISELLLQRKRLNNFETEKRRGMNTSNDEKNKITFSVIELLTKLKRNYKI